MIIRKNLILSAMLAMPSMHGVGGEDIKEFERSLCASGSSESTNSFQEQRTQNNNTCEKVTKVVIACIGAYAVQLGAYYIMSQCGDQCGR